MSIQEHGLLVNQDSIVRGRGARKEEKTWKRGRKKSHSSPSPPVVTCVSSFLVLHHFRLFGVAKQIVAVFFK